MKHVKEYIDINEKFTEDSDPVDDFIGIRKQISKFMKELDAKDTDDNALAECAKYGKTEWVKFLLARGADVNYLEGLALRWAAENGHTETVQVLLDAGADVHAMYDYALRSAANNGHAETVKVLLNAGADVHAVSNQALRFAATNGHTDTVKVLLARGADVHYLEGWALRWAARNGHTETVKVLLDAGADVHAVSNQALRWAAVMGHTETVKVLLDAGADVHAHDDYALRLAVEYNHTETVKVLQDHIAKEKKVVRESLNEKFVEDSDPVEDLGLDKKTFKNLKPGALITPIKFGIAVTHNYSGNFTSYHSGYVLPTKSVLFVLSVTNKTPNSKKIEFLKYYVGNDEIAERDRQTYLATGKLPSSKWSINSYNVIVCTEKMFNNRFKVIEKGKDI